MERREKERASDLYKGKRSGPKLRVDGWVSVPGFLVVRGEWRSSPRRGRTPDCSFLSSYQPHFCLGTRRYTTQSGCSYSYLFCPLSRLASPGHHPITATSLKPKDSPPLSVQPLSLLMISTPFAYSPIVLVSIHPVHRLRSRSRRDKLQLAHLGLAFGIRDQPGI